MEPKAHFPATPMAGADHGKRFSWAHFAVLVVTGFLVVVPLFCIVPSQAPASLDWMVRTPKPEITMGRVPAAPPVQAAPAPGKGRSPELAYDDLVSAAASHHGVDPNLVRAIITVESNFKKRAIGPKGAQGLMQLMPRTARSLGLEDAFDPAGNIEAGVRYVRELLDLYNGDVRLALAAYNAGSGRVAQYGGIPPFPTTKAFIRNVLYHQGRYQAMLQGIATPHRG